MAGHLLHQVRGFADGESPDGESIEGHRGDFLSRLDAKVLIEAPLNDSEACLVILQRILETPLGPGDLGASLGVPELTIGEGPHVEHALLRVLVAARAYGLAAVDGPYVRLDDPDGLRASALRSRGLGYDGKWCIHPAQVAVCNEVYAPTADE